MTHPVNKDIPKEHILQDTEQVPIKYQLSTDQVIIDEKIEPIPSVNNTLTKRLFYSKNG